MLVSLRSLLVITFFLVSVFSHSQTIEVSSSIDNRAIGGATIRPYFSNSDVLFTTDAFGKSPLPKEWKQDTLLVISSGYSSKVIYPKDWFGNKVFVKLSELGVELVEFEISATRLSAPIEDLPADILKIRNPQLLNPKNMADVLEQTGDVFVQRSQLGGGSPVLRGMEANRILLVVDGVRLNTPIYRGGHLQNVLRLDPNATQDIDVISGSSSPVYGSDALGGVISVNTKQARLGNEEENIHEAGGLLRISAGDFKLWNQERGGNFWYNAGFKKLAVRTSVSLNQYGDLRQGAVGLRDEWRNNFYVSRVGGSDSVTVNPDPTIQTNSGYSQIDINQKWLFSPNKGPIHKLNLQYTTTTDVNRYDRLTNVNTANQPVFSEWYYGPEQRALVSYQLEFNNQNKLFDQGKLIGAWQLNKESRNTRRFQDPNIVSRNERVNSFSLNADFYKKMSKYKIFYGGEAYHHLIESSAQSRNINTSKVSPASTRYPAEGSYVNNAAAYITFQREHLPEKRLVSTIGVRYTFNDLLGEFGNSEFYNFPFTQLRQKNSVLSGQAGLVFRLSKLLKLNAQWSQGFRSPNIDDIAKVFDSQPGNLILPNPNLKAERTNGFDAKVQYNPIGKFNFDIGGYYTFFNNAIVIRPSSFNGQDSMLYEGQLSAVQTSVNAGEAVLFGFKFRINYTVFKSWVLNANLNYTRGMVTSSVSNIPLDHIPPLFGRVALNKKVNEAFELSSWLMFNGEKPLSLYSPSGEDNLQYATVDGMPSWYTLNFSADIKLYDKYLIKVSLENLLDTNYRVFASGISAPGRIFRLMILKNF